MEERRVPTAGRSQLWQGLWLAKLNQEGKGQVRHRLQTIKECKNSHRTWK